MQILMSNQEKTLENNVLAMANIWPQGVNVIKISTATDVSTVTNVPWTKIAASKANALTRKELLCQKSNATVNLDGSVTCVTKVI